MKEPIMTMTQWIIGTVVSVFFSGAAIAHATENATIFIGVSGTHNTSKALNNLKDENPSDNIDTSAVGFRAFGGYDFSNYFGTEGGFSSFGKYMIDSEKFTIKGYDASLLGKIPLSPSVALTARFGYLFLGYEVRGSR
jgi:hypothetical protein